MTSNKTPTNPRAVDVIVVGAGFGGLGMAAQLKREGQRSFVVLERAEDVGGTWRDNHYPGAACDVPSHLYSFSFRLNPEWTHMYAPQPEIHEYLRNVAIEERIDEHIIFGAEVTRAAWDETNLEWTVETPQGVFTGGALVSAVGHLSEPKLPAVPGLADFEGLVFHSAQWDHSVDLSGKRVGVIGSGATAIQVVPEVAKLAQKLVVFQRSAPYITPRPDRAYTTVEKGLFRKQPQAMQTIREEIFWSNEERYAQRRGTPSLVEPATRAAVDHLHSQVPDPTLRDKLTPDYTYGCKRVLKSNDYYPTFNLPHVTLETGGIERIHGSQAFSGEGASHELDIIIACTGFEATDLPIAYRVYGREGQTLSEAWADGMQAYATTAVSGFPNLWIINGPNTGLGHNSAVYILEAQIDYIMGALEYQRKTGAPEMEVSRRAENRYMERLNEMAKGTVWLDGGCKSWYVDQRSGRLTTLWPEPAYTFRRVNSCFEPRPYVEERTILAETSTDSSAQPGLSR